MKKLVVLFCLALAALLGHAPGDSVHADSGDWQMMIYGNRSGEATGTRWDVRVGGGKYEELRVKVGLTNSPGYEVFIGLEYDETNEEYKVMYSAMTPNTYVSWQQIDSLTLQHSSRKTMAVFVDPNDNDTYKFWFDGQARVTLEDTGLVGGSNYMYSAFRFETTENDNDLKGWNSFNGDAYYRKVGDTSGWRKLDSYQEVLCAGEWETDWYAWKNGDYGHQGEYYFFKFYGPYSDATGDCTSQYN